MDRLVYEQILVAGDFSGAINNALDRSGKKKVSLSEGKLPKPFFDLANQENLEDQWRENSIWK